LRSSVNLLRQTSAEQQTPGREIEYDGLPGLNDTAESSIDIAPGSQSIVGLPDSSRSGSESLLRLALNSSFD
jgi:hypothetical protein